MPASRQLRLGAFMRPASIHTGAWRYPGAYPDANFNFAHIKRFAQKLERGQVRRLLHGRPHGRAQHAARRAQAQPHGDLVRAVHAAVGAGRWRPSISASSPPARPPSTRPITSRAGSPRSTTSAAAAPAGTSSPPPIRTRRSISGSTSTWSTASATRRAREFYDVVTGLWDSWADDAFIRDVESGIYFDPDKLHVLDHKGKYLSVRGPLNIARPVQGWPVIVQAGASEAGRQLAAETAEAVFTAQSSLAVGQQFYADVKGRAEKVGRSRDHMKILPGCFVVVGDTVEEARAKRAKLDSLVHYANAIGSLSIALGHDASKLRSGRAAARHPREQRQQERPPARDRARRAREPHGAPARAAARRLFRPRHGRHAEDHRRRDGGMARRPKAPTASPCSSPICPAGSTISSTAWCRNCSGAACSGANTRARRCARISGCRGRRTGFSSRRAHEGDTRCEQ